jgi:hypothetical protein
MRPHVKGVVNPVIRVVPGIVGSTPRQPPAQFRNGLPNQAIKIIGIDLSPRAYDHVFGFIILTITISLWG